MERDKYSPEGGDLKKDLQEKESSPDNFEFGRPSSLHRDAKGKAQDEGSMGDSRRDEAGPGEAHFVDGELDDPNMQITRETSELTEPEREGAEELNAIRHDDSRVIARPQPPLMEEGGEVRPLYPGETVND
jgi:hypothetical protein